MNSPLSRFKANTDRNRIAMVVRWLVATIVATAAGLAISMPAAVATDVGVHHPTTAGPSEGQSLAAKGESLGRYSGTLRVVHGDARNGTSVVQHWLERDDGTWTLLTGPAVQVARARPGSRVTVVAHRAGAKLDVVSIADARGSSTASQGLTPAVAGTHTVLVMLLESTTQPRDSLTQQQAAAQMATDDAWYRENSDGAFGLSSTVTGWLRISSIECTDLKATMTRAKAAAASAGFSGSYDHYMAYLSVPCPGWGGIAEVPGSNTWIGAGQLNTTVTVHELAHNLGLGHAHSADCTVNGKPAVWSSTCNTAEYGDPYSTMGVCCGHFDAAQKVQLGWLAGRVAHARSGVSTTILWPYEQRQGTAALDVAVGTHHYWLERRTPTGQDAYLGGVAHSTDGVVVHVGPESVVVDGRPDWNPRTFAALPYGASWVEPLGAVRITVGYPDGANRVAVSVSFLHNGEFVRTPDGALYRLIGGAPLHLTSYGFPELAGCVSGTGACPIWDVADLRPFAPTPVDGTFVRGTESGRIYRIAGGAPLWLNSCSPVGIDGCGGGYDVNQATIDALDHLRAVPTNFTFIRAADSGRIYRIAGGAPLWITSCSPPSIGCVGLVNVTQSTIDGLDHLRAVPSNGTLIRGAESGNTYRIKSGAPIKVSCAPNGPLVCSSPVVVNQQTINLRDHMH